MARQRVEKHAHGLSLGNMELRDHLKRAETEKQNWHNRFVSLEKKLDSDKQADAQLAEQVRQQQKDLFDLQQQLRDKEEALSEAQGELRSLQERMAELSSQVNKKRASPSPPLLRGDSRRLSDTMMDQPLPSPLPEGVGAGMRPAFVRLQTLVDDFEAQASCAKSA